MSHKSEITSLCNIGVFTTLFIRKLNISDMRGDPKLAREEIMQFYWLKHVKSYVSLLL